MMIHMGFWWFLDDDTLPAFSDMFHPVVSLIWCSMTSEMKHLSPRNQQGDYRRQNPSIPGDSDGKVDSIRSLLQSSSPEQIIAPQGVCFFSSSVGLGEVLKFNHRVCLPLKHVNEPTSLYFSSVHFSGDGGWLGCILLLPFIGSELPTNVFELHLF